MLISKDMLQVRSHAQKHFIRLEKKGLGAVVPPARRKARWTDKQLTNSVDGSSDSDQDMSGLNQQAHSSSSMSTLDHHQARASAGSSAQCTEGMTPPALNCYLSILLQHCICYPLCYALLQVLVTMTASQSPLVIRALGASSLAACQSSVRPLSQSLHMHR